MFLNYFEIWLDESHYHISANKKPLIFNPSTFLIAKLSELCWLLDDIGLIIDDHLSAKTSSLPVKGTSRTLQ